VVGGGGLVGNDCWKSGRRSSRLFSGSFHAL
jgi:hypothetical protein